VKTFDEMITLKSIDIKIRKGEFVAIIGEVGSGKSSLISALIGDMIYIDNETVSQNKHHQISSQTKEIIEQLNHAIRVANSKTAKNPPIYINGTVSLVE